MRYARQQGRRTACAFAQSDESLCKSLEYLMTDELLAGSIWVDKHERSCAGSSGSEPSEVPHFLEIPHHGSNV